MPNTILISASRLTQSGHLRAGTAPSTRGDDDPAPREGTAVHARSSATAADDGSDVSPPSASELGVSVADPSCPVTTPRLGNEPSTSVHSGDAERRSLCTCDGCAGQSSSSSSGYDSSGVPSAAGRGGGPTGGAGGRAPPLANVLTAARSPGPFATEELRHTTLPVRTARRPVPADPATPASAHRVGEFVAMRALRGGEEHAASSMLRHAEREAGNTLCHADRGAGNSCHAERGAGNTLRHAELTASSTLLHHSERGASCTLSSHASPRHCGPQPTAVDRGCPDSLGLNGASDWEAQTLPKSDSSIASRTSSCSSENDYGFMPCSATNRYITVTMNNGGCEGGGVGGGGGG